MRNSAAILLVLCLPSVSQAAMLLGTYTERMNAGSSIAPTDTITIKIGMATFVDSGVTVLPITVSMQFQDLDGTISLTSATPGFAEYVSRLTDGIDSELQFLPSSPLGGGGGSGTSIFAFFYTPHGVDFQGASIEQVDIVVDVQPEAGVPDRYDIAWTYNVYGTPRRHIAKS